MAPLDALAPGMRRPTPATSVPMPRERAQGTVRVRPMRRTHAQSPGTGTPGARTDTRPPLRHARMPGTGARVPGIGTRVRRHCTPVHGTGNPMPATRARTTVSGAPVRRICTPVSAPGTPIRRIPERMSPHRARVATTRTSIPGVRTPGARSCSPHGCVSAPAAAAAHRLPGTPARKLSQRKRIARQLSRRWLPSRLRGNRRSELDREYAGNPRPSAPAAASHCFWNPCSKLTSRSPSGSICSTLTGR